MNAAGRHSDDAFGATDEVVVSDGSLVRVKVLAGFQRDGVELALGVAELDAVADAEQIPWRGS